MKLCDLRVPKASYFLYRMAYLLKMHDKVEFWTIQCCCDFLVETPLCDLVRMHKHTSMRRTFVFILFPSFFGWRSQQINFSFPIHISLCKMAIRWRPVLLFYYETSSMSHDTLRGKIKTDSDFAIFKSVFKKNHDIFFDSVNGLLFVILFYAN